MIFIIIQHVSGTIQDQRQNKQPGKNMDLCTLMFFKEPNQVEIITEEKYLCSYFLFIRVLTFIRSKEVIFQLSNTMKFAFQLKEFSCFFFLLKISDFIKFLNINL